MTVVALGSVKASPGVTTTMLGLAAVWPSERPLLLVEADPDGGVLAARCSLRPEPGLATLAAAGRHSLDPEELERHTQILPGGVSALVGPTDPDEARRAVDMAASRLVTTLAFRTGRDALLDCGRLGPHAPSWALVGQADAAVIVARPRLDELQHVRARLHRLQPAARRPALVLIGERPYPPDEVASALDVPVVGVIANDASGAGALAGWGGRETRLRRSLLIRSAREVLASLMAFARESCESVVSPLSSPEPAQTGSDQQRSDHESITTGTHT
ncbi:MAG: hypothetical protein M3O70_17850 [Actinomycetota bacterium]|nr:hypothetical protein [Actinomycetota bacterium]